MIELRVLGPLQVTGASGPIALRGPKQRRLLAALAVKPNMVVSNGRLAECVWGDEQTSQASNSLKVYIGRLRGALPDDGSTPRIVTHPAGYALEIDRDRLDATRFTELVDTARSELDLGEVERAIDVVEQALALWRGPAYEEFADEEWARSTSTRLENERRSALELRIDAHLAGGRHRELLPELDELIDANPYADGLRAQRMLALYRCGRHVEALREFQHYRQLLADEVGVDPGVELVELEGRIVAHDDELLAPVPSIRRIRDYEVGERIAANEHSVLYRGRQLSVDREVAIRVIRPELANHADFIRRFEAEAQLIAGVEHPHIVPLYDFWREPGSAYLVMRWFAGGSLRRRVESDGAFRSEAVLAIADQVGRALATAHGVGVVHGRIRPASVLFDEHDNAYLSGFGLGAERATSIADDIAGLGAALAVAITDDGSGEPAQSSRSDDPAARRLQATIRRARSSDPTERFVDVAEMVSEVGAVMRSAANSTSPIEELGPVDLGVNPYKGLRSFGEADSDDFFGRDDLIDRLDGELGDTGFAAVVGPSGSGKSSLVRAGLVPRQRHDDVFVATMVPGARPFEELERALLRLSPHRDPALLATLTTAMDGISQAVRAVLPPGGQLLLVVDQFEELFTITDRQRRDAFLDRLVELVENGVSPARVIITLRADFYDRPLAHPRLGRLVRDHTVAITPLTSQELELAITAPARRTGVEFESPVVAELVAETAASPAMLPLLQYTLTELYARRRGREIGIDDYRAIGGLAGSLSARADALFSELGTANADAVRRLFTQLVTPGNRAADTRRRERVSQLAGVPDVVVDLYARARLVTFDRDPVSREPTIEVAHEALIREWPRLREWVDADREALRVIDHLSAAARAWSESGRDTDELYRGARLEAAEELLAMRADRLGPLNAEFLDESMRTRDALRQEERARHEREIRLERRSANRLRQIVVILAVATLLAGVITWWALTQQQSAQRQADIAAARELLGVAALNVDTDAELGLLLALEAIELVDDPDPQLEGDLRETLTAALSASRTTTSFAGVVAASALDGELVVTITTEGDVVLYDLTESGAPPVVIGRASEPPAGLAPPLAISADGTTIVYLEDRRQPLVWDVPAGAERIRLPTWAGDVEHVALSPDASRVIVGGVTDPTAQADHAGRGATMRDLDSGEVIRDYPIRTADSVFSDDGAWVALAVPHNLQADAVVWDAVSGEHVAELKGHQGQGGADRVAFGDDRTVVSQGRTDRAVRVWDWAAGNERATGAPTREPTAIALSRDGITLAQGDIDGSITLLDVNDGREIAALRGHRGAVTDLEFINGDRQLLSASEAGDVRIWDVDFEPPGMASWVAHDNVADAAVRADLSPSADVILTSDGTGESQRWDAVSGDPIGGPLTDRHGGVEHVDGEFSADGQLIAVGGFGDVPARTFDAHTGEVRSELDRRFERVNADVSFNPEGTLLALTASGGFTPGGDTKVVDVATGRPEGFVGSKSDLVVDWSPRGDLIASGGPDVTTRVVLAATGRTVEVLDVAVGDLAFSPDGTTLVTAGRQVHAWDTSTWEQSEPFSGHRGSINALAFGPDGHELLGGGDDDQPRIWDVATGSVLAALPPHDADVTGVAYSADGRTLVTVSSDGVLWRRPATLDELAELARDRVTRSLTDLECAQYLHLEQCPE